MSVSDRPPAGASKPSPVDVSELPPGSGPTTQVDALISPQHPSEQSAEPPGAAEDPNAARRAQLKQLKQQLALADPAAQAPETESARPSMDEVQQRELLDFLKNLVERDRNRREQLKLIKGFLDDPVAFGLQTDVIPSSSTPEEIRRRRKEVEYQVNLLSSMLKIYKGELEMLSMAEARVPDDSF